MIEKFKALDKKAQIGIGVGAAVVVIAIIAIIVVLVTGGSDKGKKDGTETETGNVTEVFGTEKGTEDVTEVFGTEAETEFGTEVGTEVGTETEMTESESQSQVQVQQPEDVEGVAQQPITTKPDGEEILGVGTADTPYMETPDLNTMSLTTVSIPAGKTVHYGIYRVSGMYLTINDPNAYVIYNGTTYNASNGKVSFKVVSDALASDAVYFEIGNKGSSSATFTLKFSNPTGTQMNPSKIDSITTAGNSFSLSLASGNTTGYYYKYTAQSTGTIKFYVSSFSSSTSGAEAGMQVTNKTAIGNPQRTFLDENVQVDENGNKYILMDVTAGDVLEIIVAATGSGRVRYPAADITWTAQYQ